VKFSLEFRNISGEAKTEIVALDPIEIASVTALLDQRRIEESSAMAITYAIQAAYRTMPNGFEYFAATAIPESLS
jgi:hypothetical protein